MKRSLWLRSSLALILVAFGLGIFSQSGHASAMIIRAKPRITRTRYRSHPYKSALSRQVDHLAAQRRKYRHPSISWNFRDIGGYQTADHKYKVRTGKMYISSYIGNIHNPGTRKIHQLRVANDIDMRNYYGTPTSIVKHPQPGEMGLRKDPYGLKLHYIHLPVETSQQEKAGWVKNAKTNNLYLETSRFRGAYDLTPRAKQTYRQSLKDILNDTRGQQSIMFNCNSGRDRSASLAAIILSLLGVKRQTVYLNYLLTNYYHYQTPYINQLARVETLYSTIDHHYGSMYNYAHSKRGLNLSSRFINEFRKQFLVKI